LRKSLELLPISNSPKSWERFPLSPKREGRGEGKVIIQIFRPAQFEMSAAFPLILTFSPGEKEQRLYISTSRKPVGPLTAQNSPRHCKRHTVIGFFDFFTAPEFPSR
jgi:hypothetical protein